MPFSFGESINYISDAVLNAPIVSVVAGSPLWTAVALTLIIVLIFLFIFRDVETDESMFLLSGRSAFWVFLLLLGTLFLHNKVLTRDVDGGRATAVYDNVYGANESPDYADDRVPILSVGELA